MASAAAQPAYGPEFIVSFRDLLLAALEHEAGPTGQVISAIPEARRDYRPDPKARTAVDLAWHIAATEVWFLESVADLSFEKMYENEKNADKLRPGSIAEIANWYRVNFAKAVARVRAMTPQQLSTTLNFFGVFNLPAFHYLMLTKSHSIHHRGQLSSYLRPMGSKVPSIYGGSADVPFQP